MRLLNGAAVTSPTPGTESARRPTLRTVTSGAGSLSGSSSLPVQAPDWLRQGASMYGRLLDLGGGNEVRSVVRDHAQASIAAALYSSPASACSSRHWPSQGCRSILRPRA